MIRLLHCWFSLVLFQTILVWETNGDPMPVASFCDHTHLEQVEAYLNDLYLSSRMLNSSQILSNNGTGFQCHCDFFGEFLECRIWTRAASDCQFCMQQESVVTDRLPLANLDVAETADATVTPLWFEFCSYIGTKEDDRIRSTNATAFCELLRLSTSNDDEEVPTRLEECSIPNPAFNCHICPDGMGTNITYFATDGIERSWSSRCPEDYDSSNGAPPPVSTSSLLYQYHLNVQPIQVILDDGDNVADPCIQQDTNGGDDDNHDELESVDQFCSDLSTIETAFTESLKDLFSFSNTLDVVDGFKCRCEIASVTTTIQDPAFQVICDAVYSDSRSGEPALYTDTHQMTMHKRKGADLYLMKSVGSCDTAISECFQQELDYEGLDIVTCLERNNTVTAAFCELCPNLYFFADTVTPAFVGEFYAESLTCDEPVFTVNPTSYFLRYRGLKLKVNDSVKCTKSPSHQQQTIAQAHRSR